MHQEALYIFLECQEAFNFAMEVAVSQAARCHLKIHLNIYGAVELEGWNVRQLNEERPVP